MVSERPIQLQVTQQEYWSVALKVAVRLRRQTCNNDPGAVIRIPANQ